MICTIAEAIPRMQRSYLLGFKKNMLQGSYNLLQMPGTSKHYIVKCPFSEIQSRILSSSKELSGILVYRNHFFRSWKRHRKFGTGQSLIRKWFLLSSFFSQMGRVAEARARQDPEKQK